jgi:hypothetical protein
VTGSTAYRIFFIVSKKLIMGVGLGVSEVIFSPFTSRTISPGRMRAFSGDGDAVTQHPVSFPMAMSTWKARL